MDKIKIKVEDKIRIKKYRYKNERQGYNIGDLVKVTDFGQGYVHYSQWFDNNAPELVNRFAKAKDYLSQEIAYKIVAKGKHLISDKMLYAIEDIDGIIFLIEECGIIKVEELETNLQDGSILKVIAAEGELVVCKLLKR